jgi:hypothetical protein
VLAAHVPALVGPDALAAMEDLDHARADPHVDLGADQRVRNRVREVVDLDVIIEIDPRAPPLRELLIVSGQGNEGGTPDCLEQLAAEVAHGTLGAVAYIAKAGTLARRVLTEGAWPYRMPVRVRALSCVAECDAAVAQRADSRTPAIDGRTTRDAGYGSSSPIDASNASSAGRLSSKKALHNAHPVSADSLMRSQQLFHLHDAAQNRFARLSAVLFFL